MMMDGDEVPDYRRTLKQVVLREIDDRYCQHSGNVDEKQE
jgi:hypothetical protein